MRTKTLFTQKELNAFAAINPIFNDQQMAIINRPTPKEAIEIKEENGRKFKSVKSAYAKAFVMMVTGGRYDFKIKNKEHHTPTKECIVEGALTIYRDSDELQRGATREQIGRHYLTTGKIESPSGGRPILISENVGDGYKAAASDCFKKCASEFGFFWDIYGQEIEEGKPHKDTPQPLSHSEQAKLNRLEEFLLKAATTDEAEMHYDTYLETAKEETDQSKTLFEKHYKRIMSNK